jgi:hypothetical protein
VVEDRHHDIIMPDVIDKRGLALSSLDDKPTFLTRADGPQIERAQIASIISIHAKYLRVVPEPEAGLEILFAGPARDPLTC